MKPSPWSGHLYLRCVCWVAVLAWPLTIDTPYNFDALGMASLCTLALDYGEEAVQSWMRGE